MSQATAIFRDCLRTLRANLPTRYPVKAERVSALKCGGDAVFINGSSPYFLIRVSKRYTDDVAISHVVCHEYAHCMVWFDDKEDHAESWGDAVGQCLSAIYTKYDLEC